MADADLALLQQWRDGDRLAGEQLCSRHFSEIYRFFEHKIPGEADDLVQETFLACCRARDQFRGRSSFRTYLFTIARNELYARLSVIARRTATEVDLNVSSLNELVSSPADHLRRQQEQAQIHAALRVLPVEQQVLLELHYWHHLDPAALAEVFDLKPGAIRVRLVRARQALRAHLGTLDPAADDVLSRSLSDLDDA